MLNLFQHLFEAIELKFRELPIKKLVKVSKLSPYVWEMLKQVQHDEFV